MTLCPSLGQDIIVHHPLGDRTAHVLHYLTTQFAYSYEENGKTYRDLWHFNAPWSPIK